MRHERLVIAASAVLYATSLLLPAIADRRDTDFALYWTGVPSDSGETIHAGLLIGFWVW